MRLSATALQRLVALGGIALSGLSLSACSSVHPPTSGPKVVVAAERQWGSIVAEVAGPLVVVQNVIENPSTDPHSYEPTSADANAVAVANLVVANGLGYDPWASQLHSAAGSDAPLFDIGSFLRLPDGSNPHRWYSPSDIRRVVHGLVDVLGIGRSRAFRSALERGGDHFLHVSLRTYDRRIAQIRRAFAGTPVAASESIVLPMTSALHLHVITPPGLLRSVSEGGEPTAAEVTTSAAQLTHHQAAVYLYNPQNTTPLVKTQLNLARAAHLPIVQWTETPPLNQSFASWQTNQLTNLLLALKGTLP